MAREAWLVADSEATVTTFREVEFRFGGRKRELAHVTRPADLARFVAGLLKGDPREHFFGIYLDGRHCIVGYCTIAIGTLTASLVHPREVFSPAIALRAAAVVLAHNHPSGNPSPSAEDREVTKRMVTAGEILGVRVIDHLVLGERHRWFSFKEDGAL